MAHPIRCPSSASTFVQHLKIFVKALVLTESSLLVVVSRLCTWSANKKHVVVSVFF